ncbi:transcription factor Pcc1 [Martensiomyces pterosporus]|nr:transcription factor Pcc1 [Martensiomyces pterosporus]
MADLPHATVLTIPFGDARLASIAKESLSVDREISGDKISRQISTDGANLVVTFHADSLRMLRVSVNGFMDSLILVTKTIEAFA